MTGIPIRLFTTLTPDADVAAEREVVWPAVPRVGEEVEVGAFAGDSVPVEHVIWKADGSVVVELAKVTDGDRDAMRDAGWTILFANEMRP